MIYYITGNFNHSLEAFEMNDARFTHNVNIRRLIRFRFKFSHVIESQVVLIKAHVSHLHQSLINLEL